MHFITFIGKLNKYRIEFLLGVCSILSGVLVIVTVFGQKNTDNKGVAKQESIVEASTSVNLKSNRDKEKIFVEISGAVYKPGVYEVEENTRLYDLLEKAEGLNKQADKAFFYRNYNQARALKDGEKVHAPSLEEVASGAFVEQPLIIFTNDAVIAGSGASSATTIKTSDEKGPINLNTSKASELEELPGVGVVTAENIIAGRPYEAIQDLRTKNIVSESLFKKIEASLSL